MAMKNEKRPQRFWDKARKMPRLQFDTGDIPNPGEAEEKAKREAIIADRKIKKENKMNKKNKGIDCISEPPTVLDLLTRLDEEYQKRQIELRARQDAGKASLLTARQKEKEITGQIAEANKIVEKMQDDFSGLEINLETKTKKEVEKGLLREADVRSGKSSLKDFHEQGKFDKEISKEIIEKVTEELEMASKAIRGKKLEILKLQKELYGYKQTIRSLLNQSGFQFLVMLDGMKEYGNEQMNLFAEYMPSYEIEIKETQRKLWLTEGKSMYGGQRWESRTVREARNIAFDPCLPFDLIGKLRSQLAGFEDDAKVSVVYYFKEHDVDVILGEPRQKIITTTSTARITSFEQKGRKVVKTSDLEERKNE